MRLFVRTALCTALLSTACRRPEPENPWAREKNPGLDPHPQGMTLKGKWAPAWSELSFRLDPGRQLLTAEQIESKGEDEIYLNAARSGQAWAQARLGIKYAEGEDLGLIGDGLRWLNLAAERNDTDALRALASLAARGRGLDQSDRQAFKYMLRAAELGSAQAQYDVANMFATGQGTGRDMEAAIIWARRAAEQGHAGAQFSVGRTLLESIEQERKDEGFALLQKSADGGNIKAVLLLATVHAFGRYGMTKDEPRAEALLKPWAEKGNTDCQVVLAALYRFGDAFADRRGESAKWLQRTPESARPKSLEALYEQLKNKR